VLTGCGVVRRSAVRQSRSTETLLTDKSSGSINGNDSWQLVRTIKQRGNLSTLNGSKPRGSFDHRQAPPVSCQSCAVSKIEIGKLYRVPKSTIRFLPIFAKIDPIRFRYKYLSFSNATCYCAKFSLPQFSQFLRRIS
jgi:hypothetical protein